MILITQDGTKAINMDAMTVMQVIEGTDGASIQVSRTEGDAETVGTFSNKARAEEVFETICFSLSNGHHKAKVPQD